jgi:hypothetical protein
MKYKPEFKLLKAEPLWVEVKRLKDSGALPKLVAAGLLSPKTVTYFSIAERVNQQRTRYTRTAKAQIISRVANEFNVSNATVYRAVSVMGEPLHTNENHNQQK